MHMNRMSVYEKDFAFLLLITKRQMLYSFLCICLGCEYSLVCEYKKNVCENSSERQKLVVRGARKKFLYEMRSSDTQK